MPKMLRSLALLFLFVATAFAQREAPLTASNRAVPGEPPTPWLVYADPAAQSIHVAGTWSQWGNWAPLARTNNNLWVIDVRTLGLEPGRHEFKFIVNGQWEGEGNRELFVDDDGLLSRPPDVIIKALQDKHDEVLVYLRNPVRNPERLNVRFRPEIPVKGIQMSSARDEAAARGFRVAAGTLQFIFDPAAYGLRLSPDDRVAVAGNFNHWDGSGGREGHWRLQPRDGIWELSMTVDGLRKPSDEPHFLFKFVVNQNQWLHPPPDAINVYVDSNNNRNLILDPTASGSSVLRVVTEKPIPLSIAHDILIDGLAERTAWRYVSPGRILDSFFSEKPLGAILDRERNVTTYRIFAPRASSVHLCIFDTPEYEFHEPVHRRVPPVERYLMRMDPEDGVWEITLLGLDIGKYYSFNIDGPRGPGEGFNPNVQIADPYMLAAAFAENNSIVMDIHATNQWFSGWTNHDWETPDFQDMVIYEAHVRDLTVHPSANIPRHLRGKYAGILATAGAGTGIDHMKDIGVNMLELLPIHEFNNGTNFSYNWGYTTVGFFAPEASYAQDPLNGSQVYEFKHFVNEMHNHGIGVMIDVVYNHVGWPNLWSFIDRKYYFRLTPDYQFLNFSGVGNDFRSEAPMARRMIVDSIVHFVREFKIDGFRWDLAELIDMDTLMMAKREAEKINPKVIMVSEPWSFRGNHKAQLRNTGWAAWNDDFRHAARDFSFGRPNRDWLRRVIVGSTDIWTGSPLQSVNYVESHDDMVLVDWLSMQPNKNGRILSQLEVNMNKLAATLVFTSLGIPMINAGQEFLRSKHGFNNTYDRGDSVNMINWDDRKRPLAADALGWYSGLIHLRQSEAGRAFRVPSTPPPDYFQFIMPHHNQRMIGYIVNAPRRHPGNGFIVLLNASNQPDAFEVPLPPGNWRIIGDGTVIDPDGLPDYPVLEGGRTARISIPDVRSLILMDGF